MFRGVIDSEPSDAELIRWDAEGVRLSRSRGYTRLRFGEALAALGDRFRELGFSSLAAYVGERTSLKPRYCAEARALARRTADLPQVRAAIRAWSLPWSVAAEVARYATPDDEGELIEACRSETVRAVRRLLRDRGGGGEARKAEPHEKQEVRYSALELSGTAQEMLALEATRVAIEHMNAGPGEPGHWLECLLSEGHIELLARVGDLDPLMADVARRHRQWLEARRAAEERNVEAEEAATPAPMPEAAPESLPEEEPLPSDPVGLDRVIRQLGRELTSRDVWLGKLLERLWAARAWERLGYATETQYALDRFGMSRSSVRARIRLARQARWLEGLDDAVQRGAIGFEHASLVARVATPDTLEAWIERAGRRTFKHLKEEVRLVELIMRNSDYFEAPPGPPGDEEVAILHEMESDVVSGAFFERVVGPFGEEEAPPVSEAPATVDAEGEACFQRGEHVEQVQAQLQEMLARRVEDGGGRAAGVQMSVGASAEGRVGGQTGGVQMSVGASGRDEGAGPVGAVQMSVGASTHDDVGAGRVGAVQMSVGSARDEGAGPVGAVQMSVGASTRDDVGAGPVGAVRMSVGASGSNDAGAGELDAVQMSVGAAARGEDAGRGPVDAVQIGDDAGSGSVDTVEMSVAATEMDDAAAGRVDSVQMSVGAAVHDDAGAGRVNAVQTSVGGTGGDDPMETAAARVLRDGAAQEHRAGRRRRRAQVSIRVVAREDVALFYRELEAAFVRSDMPGTFLWFLMRTCWETHGARFRFGNKWKHIFDRDRHQCTSPVCEARDNLSNHHITYRGHGGGDEPSNQITASYFCHFEGEHGGRLKVRGTAEQPMWLLGRAPIMRVERREKTELTTP